MRGDDERGMLSPSEVGDLAAKKKEIYVAVLSHSATITEGSVANQKSDRLNIMLGARGRHMTATREYVVQSGAGKKKKKKPSHSLTVLRILCLQTL